jgi:peroxiredoxin
MSITIGDTCPTFTLLNQEGKEINIQDFIGTKNIIIYFYPKDNTPGCTIEAQEFSKLLPKFEELGAAIIGVNKDSCASHQKFVKAKKLSIVQEFLHVRPTHYF